MIWLGIEKKVFLMHDAVPQEYQQQHCPAETSKQHFESNFSL